MKTDSASLPTGVTLEHALSGPVQAPVICFVHGVGANLKQFTEQHEAFDADYRVLSLSLRGHGGSSTPSRASVADYAVRELARDVAALLDHLGLGCVHYVGNSLGGLIGYELLALDAKRLRSLTTFGTTARLQSPAALRVSVVLLARLLGPRGMGWLVGQTASRQREASRRVGEMMRETAKEALVLLPPNIAVYDYTSLLRWPTVPLLLLRGEYDGEINKELGATLEALAANPQARVAELPKAGHYANLDNPEVFNALLRTFLQESAECASAVSKGPSPEEGSDAPLPHVR